MPRDLPIDFANRLAVEPLVPAIACFLDFLNDPVFAWSGPGPLNWDDGTGLKEWTGLAGLFQLDPVQETSDTRITSLNATLNFVPNELLPSLDTAEWKGRSAAFYLLLFNEQAPGEELDPTDGVEIFRGTLDTMSVNVGEEDSEVRINIANELLRLKQPWGSYYTTADQELTFPGDTGLRFMPSLQDVDIRL